MDNEQIISTNSSSNKMIYSQPHSIDINFVKNIPKQTSLSTASTAQNIEDTMLTHCEQIAKSVPSSVNVNPKLVTVKFECGGISIATAYDLEMTVGEVKRRLSHVLDLNEEFVIFYNNDIEVQDSQALAEFSDKPYGKVLLELVYTKGEAIVKTKIKENIPTVDVVTSHVNEGLFYKDVVVGIENESVQKQWLGGYSNKLSGAEYHNAETQTMPKKKVYEINESKSYDVPKYFERDVQTPFPLVHKKVNTVVDKATQMCRSDHFISSKNDKIITCGTYMNNSMSLPTDQSHVNSATIIQRSVRKWIMRRKFRALITVQLEHLRKFKEDRQRIVQDQEDKDRAVITGAVYPVKRDDFYALFLRVEKWWKNEWKTICETKKSEAKNAASVLLVVKEKELLEAIEKHKTASKAESLKKEEMRFLEQTSRPVLFRTSKGHLATIDYLETQKAREFKEIYSALARKDVSPKERVELVINLKRLFESQYMNYEYARDIISLINREIEMINSGFKFTDLKGLQKRIEQLYLDFLRQPEFNPAAKKYKKPNLPKTLHQTFRCSRCLKLLPASKYPVHVRMRALDQCKSCTWMQNIAHKRADMSPYLKLLHQVQNSEMQKCCYSAICFILQPIGMGHLTNIIWHGRSAVSECSDISKLQHVRWLREVEWAPWNTILLTEQEARLHENVPDIFTFYDEQFVEKVRQKHILARKRFIPLLMMDHDIRSSGQWSNITDSGAFLHPSHAERMASENSEYDLL